MIKVFVNGCNGTMSKQVLLEINKSEDMTVVGGFDKEPNKAYDFPVYTDINKIKVDADVIIDFSVPSATLEILTYAKKSQTPIVIATTGFSNTDLLMIEEASHSIPIFRSSNMSFDIAVMKKVIASLSHILEGTDIEIIETHHNRKLDAPSGTALALADAINKEFDNSYEYVYSRHERREPRNKREIGISSVRGGNIVGEHSVQFFGPYETFEIKHIAHSRSVFAQGAIKAAKFLIRQKPGSYSMEDLMDVNID